MFKVCEVYFYMYMYLYVVDRDIQPLELAGELEL